MTELCESNLTRRRLLGTAGALFAWSFAPRLASASGSHDRRLVVVVLRGALDGLAAVAPVGDPNYFALRPSIALAKDGDLPALPLDSFFALHPAMQTFHRLYEAGQAIVIHAAASPYRGRSHFDGQDTLESGQAGPSRLESGWLNRLLASLPRGERVAPPHALGVGITAPLILRGTAPVLGWSPSSVPRASDDFADRVLKLYSARDPSLASALSRGLDTDRLAQREGVDANHSIQQMRRTAEGAARLMAAETGPRIAALALDGWDTHANEGAAKGLLATRLMGLDGALEVFERVLYPIWKNTTILVITEFGRTARVNGTIGTDHGTGTVALLIGGAVKGGRIIADWPGLSDTSLHEGRDLKPTTDLRQIAKGLAADLFGVSAEKLARDVFPDTAGLPALRNLIV